ncbi:Surfeit locus protein 1 [Clonorchis sinensis]|uniref:SURF1-like protein n=1 Tax=Clonorchis sinensis TaxID=79923 RepID=A0A3R7GN58_CLOSI|nr:Surfeit locus protein 1 [Clonorchis sinensis]
MSFLLFARRLSFYLPKRTKRRITWRAYALLVLPVTCYGLGYWQVQRRRWKLDLLDQLDRTIAATPVPLPSTAEASTDLPEYSPVTVRGCFDHSRELLIGPRPLITDFIKPGGYGSEWCLPQTHRPKSLAHEASSEPPPPFGYFIVTPFFLEGRPGTSILVNRGWVPEYNRDPVSRKQGQIKGIVELSGFIRYPEKPSIFAIKPPLLQCENTEHQVPHIQFSCRHIDKMARTFGTLPLLIDANYESTVADGPIGGQTRVQLRNEHASYILTWVSLGVVGTALWINYFLL